MESLKETKVLKFHPDTLQVIRKLYGLDKPGAMSDAIDILQEWIKKQNHFIKKDFGYGFRIKGMHLLSSSKSVEILVSMLKQILNAKVGGRIHVHSSLESLHEHVEKDILPQEYGGNEISLTELHQQLLDILTSEEHREHMKMMNAAGTNEEFRQTDKYNEQVLGMPGSFRALKVD